MTYFIADKPELWDELERLSKDRTKVKTAAIGYFSDNSVLKFRAGDLLVVDASDRAIETGITRLPALKSAFKNRAEIWSVPGLHAKTIVFGDCVVSGSMNASSSSMDSLIEAALCTDEFSAVANAQHWIQALRDDKEAVLVTKRFLQRAKKLEPATLPRTGLRKRKGVKKAPGRRNRAKRFWYTSATYRAFDGRSKEKAKARLRQLRREYAPTGAMIDVIEGLPSQIPDWLRKSDEIFLGCLFGRNDTKCEVWRSCVVLEIQRAGYRKYVHHAVKPEVHDQLLDWQTFTQLTRSLGIRITDPESDKEISAAKAMALIEAWPRKKRQARKA